MEDVSSIRCKEMLVLLIWTFLFSPWLIVIGLLVRSAADRVSVKRKCGKPIVQFRLATLMIYFSLIQAFLATLCWLARTAYDLREPAIDAFIGASFVVILALMGWAAIGDRRHALARRLAKSNGKAIGPPDQNTADQDDEGGCINVPESTRKSDDAEKARVWWRHRFAAARLTLSAWSFIQSPPTKN